MNKVKNTHILATLIIVVGVCMSLFASWNQSLTFDENLHIGAGYSYLKKQQIVLNPEHPPLFKNIAALPLMFLPINSNASFDSFFHPGTSTFQKNSDQYGFAQSLIYQSGNDADLIRHISRLPMLVFFILSAIIIYIWTKKLYGHGASIIVLLLFSFSPTILAHAPLVTSDIAALFGALLAIFFFLKYLSVPNLQNLVYAGLAFGIAQVCKFSMILLVPFLFVVGFLYMSKTKKISIRVFLKNIIALYFIGFIAVILPLYTLNSDSIVQPLVLFLKGISMVLNHVEQGQYSYIFGHVSSNGWWYYFPVNFILKESLSYVLLCVITVIFGVSIFIKKARLISVTQYTTHHITEVTFIAWIIFYLSVSMLGNLNIGIRHLLCIYPFMMILIAGGIVKIYTHIKSKSQKMIYAIIITLLLIWYSLSSTLAFPYYLSYFSELAGPKEYHSYYLADSNIDWGQDLLRFRDWVNDTAIKKIETDYFGTTYPPYYLKEKFIDLWPAKYADVDDFKNRNNSDGWIAVSVNNLKPINMRLDNALKLKNALPYPWLAQYTPITVIGSSIVIYRVK